MGVAPALALLERAERGEGTAVEIAEVGWTLEGRLARALARFRLELPATTPLTSLSGGQRTRAGLACVLGGNNPPSLLILDEPTNHLDIESVEIVEAGLRAYDGALLVVSHDRRFWEAIAISRLIEVMPDD